MNEIEIINPIQTVVIIPTNLPSESDPRKLSKRAVARFQCGISYAQKLREQHGRANVLVCLIGGWPLYDRLPLSVHHCYAALKEGLMSLDDIDLIFFIRAQ